MHRLSELSMSSDLESSPSFKDIVSELGRSPSDVSHEHVMTARDSRVSHGCPMGRRRSAASSDLLEQKRNRVMVAVRMRPLNNSEKSSGSKEVWRCTDRMVEELDEDGRTKRGKTWEFDRVFNSKAATTEVYEKLCKGIVQSAMEGYNGTVFAYGQTSSGKTYTVMGEPKNNPGVMPQAILDVFDWVTEHRESEWDINVSFVEIYNEQITDLLQSNSKKAVGLKIYEDKVMGPSIKDAVEWRTLNSRHAIDVFREGEKRRAAASTAMNETSSRSHALFRIRVESRNIPQTGEDQMHSANMATVASEFLTTQEAIRADHASLYLVDQRANELYVQAGEITLRLPMDKGVAGSVATTGATANIADAYQDPRFNRNIDKKTGYRTRSLLCMPVRSKGSKSGQILGVVQFINKTTPDVPSFTEEDEARVRELTDLVGPLLGGAQSMARITANSILNLVDLAGSERIKKSGTTGAAFKEAAYINTSLMMLGTCVSQLSEGKEGAHIPFRNSKLTHLLTTSLGGNANTCIVTTISPASRNRLETISSLGFASRAMRIVNGVKQNISCDQSDLVDAYEAEITRLKNELRKVTNPAFQVLGMGIQDGQAPGLMLQTGAGKMLSNVSISPQFLNNLRQREDEAANAEAIINQQGVEPKVKFAPMLAVKAHGQEQNPSLVIQIRSVNGDGTDGTNAWLTEEAFEKHLAALRGEDGTASAALLPRVSGVSRVLGSLRRNSSMSEMKGHQREDWELSQDSIVLVRRARQIMKDQSLPPTFVEEVRMTASAVEEANTITEQCRPRDDLVFVADITVNTANKPVPVAQLFKRRQHSDISEMLYAWDMPEMLARLAAMRMCQDSWFTTGYLLQGDDPDPWYDDCMEAGFVEPQAVDFRPSDSRLPEGFNVAVTSINSNYSDDEEGLPTQLTGSESGVRSGSMDDHRKGLAPITCVREPLGAPGEDGEAWSPKSPRSPFSPTTMRQKLSINPDRLNRIKSIPRKRLEGKELGDEEDADGQEGSARRMETQSSKASEPEDLTALLPNGTSFEEKETRSITLLSADSGREASVSEFGKDDTSRWSSKEAVPESVEEAEEDSEAKPSPMTDSRSRSPPPTDEDIPKSRGPSSPPSASPHERALTLQPSATGARPTRVVYRLQRDGSKQDRSHTPVTRLTSARSGGASLPSNVRVASSSRSNRDIEALRRSLPQWSGGSTNSQQPSGRSLRCSYTGSPALAVGRGAFMAHARASPFTQSASPVLGSGSSTWQKEAARNRSQGSPSAGTPSGPCSIPVTANSTPRLMSMEVPASGTFVRAQPPWANTSVVVREPRAVSSSSVSSQHRRVPVDEEESRRQQEDSVDSGNASTAASQDLKDLVGTSELRNLLKDVVREVVKEEVSPLRDFWVRQHQPWSTVPVPTGNVQTNRQWSTVRPPNLSGSAIL